MCRRFWRSQLVQALSTTSETLGVRDYFYFYRSEFDAAWFCVIIWSPFGPWMNRSPWIAILDDVEWNEFWNKTNQLLATDQFTRRRGCGASVWQKIKLTHPNIQKHLHFTDIGRRIPNRLHNVTTYRWKAYVSKIHNKLAAHRQYHFFTSQIDKYIVQSTFSKLNMITEMGGQDYSIEFYVSFPTIYHYVVCDDGKVPAKIVLLYGGKSSYVLTEGTFNTAWPSGI